MVTAPGPALLSRSAPISFSTRKDRHCTFITIDHIVQLLAFSHFRLFTEELVSPGANMEPSLEGLIKLAGCEGISEEV